MTRPEDITQADRDAAISVCRYTNKSAAAIKRGEADGSALVQAFARHRLAHTPTGVPRENACSLCKGSGLAPTKLVIDGITLDGGPSAPETN